MTLSAYTVTFSVVKSFCSFVISVSLILSLSSCRFVVCRGPVLMGVHPAWQSAMFANKYRPPTTAASTRVVVRTAEIELIVYRQHTAVCRRQMCVLTVNH